MRALKLTLNLSQEFMTERESPRTLVSVTNKAVRAAAHGTSTDTTILSFLALYIVASTRPLSLLSFVRQSLALPVTQVQGKHTRHTSSSSSSRRNFLVSSQCSKANNGVGRTSGKSSSRQLSFLSHSHKSLSKTFERTQNSEVYVYKKSDTGSHTHTHTHTRKLKMHAARHQKLGEPRQRARQHKRTSTFHYQLKHRPIFCLSLNAFLSNRMGKRSRCNRGSVPPR